MSEPAHTLRFSFQTKVLAPVLAVLVILPVIILGLVNRTMSRQVEDEARQTLNTADGIFLNVLENRAGNLAAYARNLANDPRLRATAKNGDPKTLTTMLADLLKEARDETETMMFTSDAGVRLAGAQRPKAVKAEELEQAAATIIQHALGGELATGMVSVGGRTSDVICAPVLLPTTGQFLGVLTIATHVSESMMQELRQLTRAELFLVAGGTVTASTIRPSDQSAELLHEVADSAAAATRRILPVVIRGEHYFALTDDYARQGPQGGFRYVLLSTYEPRLRDLERTQLTLLAVSGAGILLSGFFVWLFIRRITQPLIELRKSAEAVGRGDFTQRITRFSSDECGAVAVAFNDMTGNLQASRAELDKAVGSLRTTQAQLIQSEKLSAVGQFVAGIAHELNNPLTAVIGFSDLLHSMDVDPQHRGYLDHISKSATRCHKIVNSLLGFSRQHEPERKPVNLNDLADAVLDIIGYDLRSSNLKVVKEYQAELPLILGDSHQLQQVVLNIISNARQALEPFRRDGQITLRTGNTDTHVWLRIKDNGPGISRENLARIFDPFFTTKPQGKGTGLGLSLSYGIMQEHRGRIHAESEPGAGTEFVLELPITEAAAQAAGRSSSVPPLPAGAPGLLVLVIDDEESILHLVQEVLRLEGHRVETAVGGHAALELIGRNRYDVIVSDWKMPGLNGINLFEELLVRDPVAAKRMLFMTGDVIKENFQEFLRKHTLTCLPKPFALREFHAAIARIISVR